VLGLAVDPGAGHFAPVADVLAVADLRLVVSKTSFLLHRSSSSVGERQGIPTPKPSIQSVRRKAGSRVRSRDRLD
jgi:hypothetical protein